MVAASTASIIARLRELGEVARVMAPDFSWPFFNVLESRIRARHKPARDKRNVKLSDELLGLGLLLIEKATALTIGRRRSDERGASVRPVRRIWRTIARVWKAVTDPKWKIDGLGISALGAAGADWWLARSARAALMALHLSGVVFRRKWKPRLKPWGRRAARQRLREARLHSSRKDPGLWLGKARNNSS